jgi:ATP-dependent DNA helicase RecQ
VYQAIVNYLQLPTGLGEGRYYDFDLNDFLKKFRLDTQLAIYALKALEQEEMMSFNEQVFLPGKLHFICNKSTLEEFEKAHPGLELIIKTLLRTYEGIFDQPVAIFEKNLAYLLRMDLTVVKDQLKTLHGFGIVEYQPQKDKPQLLLIQDRIREDQVRINQELYQRRKKQFESRINSMIAFTTTSKYCRSTYIGSYFGDTALKDCGICDNCLNRLKTPLTPEEFEKIRIRIVEVLGDGPLSSELFFNKLADIKTEKLHKVVEFLQGEHKLQVDSRDHISVKKR